MLFWVNFAMNHEMSQCVKGCIILNINPGFSGLKTNEASDIQLLNIYFFHHQPLVDGATCVRIEVERRERKAG